MDQKLAEIQSILGSHVDGGILELYPEYTLLPETYRIVYTDGETEEESGEESEEETEEDIYLLLQKASPKQIRFRSKLWEFLCSLKKG